MDNEEWLNSIRIDKPISDQERIKHLKKQLIIIQMHNTPLWGVYIIFVFYMVTQAIVLQRPNPPNIFIDIISMLALAAHTYAFIRLLRRYLALEIAAAQYAMKKLEDDAHAKDTTR